MTRVTWGADMPTEVRAAVEPHLPDALRFVPGWVADLDIAWGGDETESAAMMTTQAEYRMATLTIEPDFLGMDARQRAEVLRHEMLHLVVQPLVNVAADVIDASGADDRMKAWAIEQSRRAQEGAVCDLEIILRAVAPLPVLAARARSRVRR